MWLHGMHNVSKALNQTHAGGCTRCMQARSSLHCCCATERSREPSAVAESEESARAAAAQGHTCRHGCRRRWCMVLLCCWLGCRARCRPRCSCGSRLGPGGCNKRHHALARELEEHNMHFTPRLRAHLRAGVAWFRLLSCCAVDLE